MGTDYHIPSVKGGSEGLEVSGGAEVGVEAVDVCCPVTVVGIPVASGCFYVLDNGGDPDLAGVSFCSSNIMLSTLPCLRRLRPSKDDYITSRRKRKWGIKLIYIHSQL